MLLDQPLQQSPVLVIEDLEDGLPILVLVAEVGEASFDQGFSHVPFNLR